jgi:hypothetical protein
MNDSNDEPTTNLDELEAALDTVDPAEAPSIAEGIAAMLGDQLDDVTADGRTAESPSVVEPSS